MVGLVGEGEGGQGATTHSSLIADVTFVCHAHSRLPPCHCDHRFNPFAETKQIVAFCTLCFDELDVTLETNDNDDGNGDGDESPPSGSVAQPFLNIDHDFGHICFLTFQTHIGPLAL